MTRGKPICKEIRIVIINKFKSGKSYGDIAIDLKLPRSTVQGIVKKYEENLNYSNNVANRGRISKITFRDKRALGAIIKQNRRSTVRDIASKWSETIGKPVKREWTRQKMKDIGYGFYKAKEKPLLTALQMKKRLLWIKEKRSWVQRQWNYIIFSDESKFDVCVGDARKRVLRKSTEAYHKDCLKRTVKFPASLMVWGCMSSKGVGQLHFIDGIVNAEKYINILQQNLLPSIPRLADCGEYIFQHDGASSHTAKATKKWLQENGIDVLDWPSSSPDLNPIENLWALMKRKLRNDPQRTTSGLKAKIQEIWESITPEECKKLINTMPKRLDAVKKSKGGVTQF